MIPLTSQVTRPETPSMTVGVFAVHASPTRPLLSAVKGRLHKQLHVVANRFRRQDYYAGRYPTSLSGVSVGHGEYAFRSGGRSLRRPVGCRKR